MFRICFFVKDSEDIIRDCKECNPKDRKECSVNVKVTARQLTDLIHFLESGVFRFLFDCRQHEGEERKKEEALKIKDVINLIRNFKETINGIEPDSFQLKYEKDKPYQSEWFSLTDHVKEEDILKFNEKETNNAR